MVVRLWWVWIAATGCGGGIHSSKDAPFDVGAIKAGLWSPSADNDDQFQSAILVLSDEEVECGTLADKPLTEALDLATRGGKGLVFALDQTVADGGAVLEWTGTWTQFGELPGSATWGVRTLYAGAFETGVVYEITSEPADWLRLDDVGSDEVKGEFWTKWWWGSFKAEACGAYEGDVVDTGAAVTGS